MIHIPLIEAVKYIKKHTGERNCTIRVIDFKMAKKEAEALFSSNNDIEDALEQMAIIYCLRIGKPHLFKGCAYEEFMTLLLGVVTNEEIQSWQ